MISGEFSALMFSMFSAACGPHSLGVYFLLDEVVLRMMSWFKEKVILELVFHCSFNPWSK